MNGLNSMNHLIRKMERNDCKDITHVITVAWNETYRGIVPDTLLDNMYLNEEERTANSLNRFNEKDNHQFVLEVDNKLVGYMNIGLTDDKEYKNCGEIHAIYIINGYKGYGFGKELFEAGIKELKEMNCDKMLIGCLEGNPSNKFYEHMGGKFIKQRIFEKLQLPENVYYFDIR